MYSHHVCLRESCNMFSIYQVITSSKFMSWVGWVIFRRSYKIWFTWHTHFETSQYSGIWLQMDSNLAPLSSQPFGQIIQMVECSFKNYFEQGVPWHSGSYRVWIHSEARTSHDKNIQSFRYFHCLLWTSTHWVG